MVWVLFTTCVWAQQNELKVAIAQTGSPRRFLAGDERSQILVLIASVSDKPQRVWQIWNSWGARTTTLELTDPQGTILGYVINGQQAWTMNGPTFDTIAPGDYQVIPISINHQTPWELRGEVLKALTKDTWHKVRIRVIFTSKDAEGKGVWTGQLESPFYDFELRIRDNQFVGDDPPLARSVPPQDRKSNVPDLVKMPDGDYAVNLEWWGKKQALTIHIHNNKAEVIETNDPLLADMKATFQKGDEGVFHIFFKTKNGEGGSQYWIPQPDGSFIIKEVPDRGEKQRATPLPNKF